LRGYGQRDPLNEYKAESFNLFEAMSQSLREMVTAQLMRLEIVQGPPPEEQPSLPYMEAHKVDPMSGDDEMSFADASLAPALAGNGNGTSRAEDRNPNDPTSWGKVGRNEMCPCGSGKKYKQCHGRLEA
jgi:preprotein translocase subunit SecA